MKARSQDTSSSQANSDTEAHVPHDLSILRKPIQTSVTGFNEAIKAYEDGTAEIKKLLAHECDIIYECKACRNIFRSLANFISHKRIYCKNNFNSAQHFHFRHDGCIDQDISTIIQAEQEYVNHNVKDKNQIKDLGSIIDRLVRREQSNRLMKLSDFYDQVNYKLTQDEILEKKQFLQLDKVNNSKVAVFQTIKRSDDDNIRKEVNEVHDLMLNDKTVLGPDGKIILPERSLSAGPLATNTEFVCEICHGKFSTEKTLKVHIKAKHIPSTFVYPCPSCPQSFLQPSAVIRHLNNDHKKSMKRIRLMRDAIFRRRTRIDEIQVKGPSRELARLYGDKDRSELQNKTWTDNVDSIDTTSTCTYCAKSFERRAALITHTKNCPHKGNKLASLVKRNNEDLHQSKENGNGSGGKDDDSSNSSELFLTMLNKEKLIQASVEESLLDEKTEISETEIIREITEKVDEPVVEVVVSKNKRKRNRVRKTILEPMTVTDDADNIYWNLDGEGNLRIVKPDPINGDCLINVTTKDIANIKSEGKSKTPTSEIEKTTDCTICNKKFANISNLRRHVAMFHYRQKKFGCKLCDYKAFRKIDIINHLSSVHSITNENDEASQLVILFKIDKNKFNEEKIKAVAEALIKLNDQQRMDSENVCDDSGKSDDFIPITIKEEIVEPNILNENSNIKYEDTNGSKISGASKRKSKTYINRSHKKHERFMKLHYKQNSESSLMNEPIKLEPLLPFTYKQEIVDPEMSNENSNTDYDDTTTNGSISDSSSKRRGRPKNSKNLPKPPADSDDIKIKIEKLSRHSSTNSLGDDTSTAKRPVRNRIKTVNKDFVYDLSNLLKKEAEAYKEHHIIPISKSYKRKSSNYVTEENSKEEIAIPVIPTKRFAYDLVKGAAIAMAKLAVSNNRACFNKPPEIPSERPIVPAKIIQLRRSEGIVSDWRDKYESTNNTNSTPKINRRSSNDKLFEALTQKKQRLIKSLSPPLSTARNDLDIKSIELESNVISGRHIELVSNDLMDIEIPVKCSTEQEFHQYLIANDLADSGKNFLVSSSTPIGNGGCGVGSSSSSSSSSDAVLIPSSPTSNVKRITLMQRLAENKSKQLQQKMLNANLLEHCVTENKD